MTSWFIFSKMSSLVRRFITASSKDQSSNKPLFKQIGPILKHFKQCQCQPVKFFFSLRFDLSWETSDWRMQTVSEENPTKYEGITRRYILPSPPPPPLHTHAQKRPNWLFRYPYLKHIFSQEYLVFSSIFVPFSWTIKACKKSKKAVKEKGKFVILLKY